MAKYSRFDFIRHGKKVERVTEDLAPAGEMSAHNRMPRMDLVERSPLIRDIGAEKTGGQLKFKFFDTAPVGVAKEKSDHAIIEDAIDEMVDNLPQSALATQLVK
jgi:hypothetical protein